MNTITAQMIADKAEKTLLDETNVRWTGPELLGWINSGAKEIVIYKPNALTSNSSVSLVAGTKQAIPASGVVLLDVTRNMGSNGTTPGRAITGIDRSLLDTMDPYWHSGAAAAEVVHFCADKSDPKTFYVWPPQPAATSQRVEVVVSVSPAELAQLADTIPLDDIYETLLIDYVLYRALSKDSEHTANMQRADYHYKAFLNALGIKSQAEAAFAPPMKSNKQPTGV